jgi:hypothetical protein
VFTGLKVFARIRLEVARQTDIPVTYGVSAGGSAFSNKVS